MEPRFGLLDYFPTAVADKRSESLAVAEINNQLFDNIIKSNSNCVFGTLNRALVETQQHHVINYIEYSGGEYHNYFFVDVD